MSLPIVQLAHESRRCGRRVTTLERRCQLRRCVRLPHRQSVVNWEISLARETRKGNPFGLCVGSTSNRRDHTS